MAGENMVDLGEKRNPTVAEIRAALIGCRRAVYHLSGPPTDGLPFSAIYDHITAAHDVLTAALAIEDGAVVAGDATDGR